MHRIAGLDPSLKSSVRAQIYHTLAHFAKGGNHGPIDIKHLFLMAADGLVDAGIIEKPPFAREQRLVQLKKGFSHNLFPNCGIDSTIADLMRQTLWELYLQGILAPAPRRMEILDDNLNRTRLNPLTSLLDIDSVMFTSYGMDILIDVSDRIQVHDPDGYLANFYSAKPEPDPEMMRYLGEGVQVFRGGHLLATVVLLGIASERLIEVLALSLRDALGDPRGSQWFHSKYEKKRDISDRFEAVSAKLMGEYGQELDKQRLKEGLQKRVRAVFETIRDARNDIAHPKGRKFTWNAVSGYLFLFVDYFGHINKIIAFLADHR